MRSVASAFGAGGVPMSSTTGQSAELSAAGLMAGGQPLDGGMRGSLEASIGSDLSGVRVHSDAQAAASAQSYGARAFAIGQHIHFGAGQYDPSSGDGQHLIAHEVAHTVQQRGATTVQGMPSVSSPTDLHEVEAERFATQFATGGPTPGLTPISRGGVARVHIQRQTVAPTAAEMARALGQQLVAERGQGPEAVVAKAKQMRANADTSVTKKAVELAIRNTLNDTERAVLEGRAPPKDGDPKAKGKGGKGGDGDLSKGTEPAADTPADGKTDANTKTPPSDEKGKGAADSAAGGTQVTPQTATPPPPVTTAQALQPAKPMDQSHRALVQQELGFHENWKALSGSGADRAAHLFGGLGNDTAQGLKGGAFQVAGGLGVEFLAKAVPVPGVGNMLGGALSTYWLFAGGGAGAVTDLKEGWAALTQEGIGGLQRTADIIQMIKSLMDLVGNVCNVLSGLAYAFAAIAALGGLLSFLCPPLAFLVPYIPAAINFGRLCGGVAQVCIAVSNLISPLPAAFRALHIITSNDDPVKLVGQEQQYHGELQGAIANYSSAAFSGARDSRTAAKTKGVSGKALTGATLKGALNPIKPMVGGLKAGAASTKDAYGDMKAGNAQTREALGMSGKSKDQLRAEGKTLGKEHFNSKQKSRLEGSDRKLREERAKALAEKDGEIKTLREKVEDRKELVKKAQRKPKGKKQWSKARHRAVQSKLEKQLAAKEAELQTVKDTYDHKENHQAGLRSRWGGRGAKNDVQGEAGAALDNARATAGSSDDVGADGDPKKKKAPEKTKDGHIKLPSPPGTLQDVDKIDTEIQGMQQQLQQQQQNTGAAKSHGQKARTQATQLGQVDAATSARKGDLDKGAGTHQKVAADNTAARAKADQSGANSDQGLQKAADALQPIAGPLRAVDGVVQQVPKNRFFNVSGTQKNLGDMTKAVNEITGAGPDAKTAQDSGKATIDQRDTQIATAKEARDANQTGIVDLQGKVKADKEKTAAVATDADQQAKASKDAELTLEQQIEQKKQAKDQKWSQLVGWAQQHYGVRQTVK